MGGKALFYKRYFLKVDVNIDVSYSTALDLKVGVESKHICVLICPKQHPTHAQ